MTTTTDPTVEPGDAFYEAHHVELIHIVREHRQEAKRHTDAAEGPAAMLRSYLQTEDVPELVDGERGLRARLQERSGWEWDLRNASAGVIIELQQRGLLRVDNAAFDALRKAAPSGLLDDAARYRRQITASVALMIEPLKD